MSKSKSRTYLVLKDYLKYIKDHRIKAKEEALQLLNNCLNAHILDPQEQELLVQEISEVIDKTTSLSTDVKPGEFIPAELTCVLIDGGLNSDTQEKSRKRYHTRQNRSNSIKSRSEFSSSVRKDKSSQITSSDDHNETCEVCDAGGDLLCCDTCTLVFHLKCYRPKLTTIPKGKWSCVYCILNNSLDINSKNDAKNAIRIMNRLAQGYNSDEATHDTKALRCNRSGTISIVQYGRKYLVRRTHRKQSIELNRYYTLEEALLSTKGSNKLTEGEEMEGKSNKKKDWNRRNRNEDESNDEDTEGYDSADNELWCTYCIDDPTIEICAFCGCQKCFGKFDSDLLILCDDCERETHIYCLYPPVSSIPTDDPWYCSECMRAQSSDATRKGNPLNMKSSKMMIESNSNTPGLMDRLEGVDLALNPLQSNIDRSTELDVETSLESLEDQLGLTSDGSIENFNNKKKTVKRKSSEEMIHSVLKSKKTLEGMSKKDLLTSPNAVKGSTNPTNETTGLPHRGRGRPPGTIKRIKANPVYKLPVTTLPEPIPVIPDVISYEPLSLDPRVIVDYPIQIPIIRSPVRPKRIVGINQMLELIQHSTEDGTVWGDEESKYFQMFCYWAPVKDIKTALEALKAKRTLLSERIRNEAENNTTDEATHEQTSQNQTVETAS